MKFLIRAATVAALGFSTFSTFSTFAPVIAATVTAGVTPQTKVEMGRNGRGCDTAHASRSTPVAPSPDRRATP